MTVQSGVKSGRVSGSRVGGAMNLITTFDTHQANTQAAHQATADKTRPSASSPRTTLLRDAPSDWRSASSRCRTTARAISRLATFAHTITIVSNVTTEKIASIRSPKTATTLSPPAVAE